MAKRQLPDAQTLRKFLRYEPDTGHLYWLPRGEADFQDNPKNPAMTAAREAKRWNSRFANKRAFTAKNSEGYLIGSIFHQTIRAHRLIWAIVYGDWPSRLVDHANGDKTDNRIKNLRQATSSQNVFNQRKHKPNSTGFRGVMWHKPSKRFRSQIKVAGEVKMLGFFATAEEAHEAYLAASQRFFGVFSPY